MLSLLIVAVLSTGFISYIPPREVSSNTGTIRALSSGFIPFGAPELPDPNDPQSPMVVGLSRNQSLTLGRSVQATTIAYNTPDNTNYNALPQYRVGSSNSHPLGGNFATISVDTLNYGGDMIRESMSRHGITQGFGFDIGDGPSMNGRSVEIKLHYNFHDKENLPNGWRMSDDTHFGTVNGMDGIGIVGYGALIIERSLDGVNWTRRNMFSDEDMSALHTVDFARHFSPDEYDGVPYQVHRLREVEDEYGNPIRIPDTNRFEREYVPAMADGKLVIYSPLGADMARGVYIRITFAYEIRNGSNIRNIVEQTAFFIANNSGEIAFRNLHFTGQRQCDSDCGCNGSCRDEDAEERGCDCNRDCCPSIEIGQNEIRPPCDCIDLSDDDRIAMSNLIRMAGTIKHNHGSNDGFITNFLNNTTYTVYYQWNQTTNWRPVHDAQFFYRPGRYDFRIETAFGHIRNRTVFINERGLMENLDMYLGDHLIDSRSNRIASVTTSLPVFVVGETWWSTNSVSDDHMPLIGRIENRTTGETTFVYDVLNPRRAFGGYRTSEGRITEPGEYRVTFVNNIDYFRGQQSGDFFRFVFEFIVMDIENPGPSINEALLRTNLSVSDFAAGYWGVTMPSAGTGTVTFAHFDLAGAETMAYQWMRSLVVVNSNGTFTFNGNTYPSQMTVLYSVQNAAIAMVERRHFDASNSATYLTIEEAVDEVLSLNLIHDIVVFSDTFTALNSVRGYPFLNDRVSYVVDGNTTRRETRPVRFIQVAEFESISVRLEHVGSDWYTYIAFGTYVQEFLDGIRAPTGRFRVVETNKFGISSYFHAVYVRPGDIQTTISASRSLNGIVTTHELGLANNNAPITANSFIIHTAQNEIDPYGIIRVERLGDSDFKRIYQLNEVENIILDEEGNFVITLVDRLGNTTRFPVNIFIAERVNTLSLYDGENLIKSTPVFGGQRVPLPTLNDSNNATQRFMGWSDNQGIIHAESFHFIYTADVILHSVWNYRQTTVEIFNGERLVSRNAEPSEMIILPSVSQSGLELFGFGFMQENGIIRFFRGVVFVQNVQHMRLDAMWVDRGHTIDIEQDNDSITLPQPTREGFIFVGWLHQTDHLSGTIFGDYIYADYDKTLYAMWVVDPYFIADDATSGFMAFLGTVRDIAPPIMAVILFALIIFLLSKKLKNIRFAPKANVAILGATTGASLPNQIMAVQLDESNHTTVKPGKVSRHEVDGFAPRYKGFARIIPYVAIGLMVVLTVTSMDRLLFQARQQYDLQAARTEIQRQVDVRISEERAARQVITDRRDNHLALTTDLFNDTKNSINPLGEENEAEWISESQAFLYGRVFIDLLTLGFDVFPAVAILPNGREAAGFGFTNFEDIYESEYSDKFYFGTGFVAFSDTPIISTDLGHNIFITPQIDDWANHDEFGFLLTFGKEFGALHYIAFGYYVQYSVGNYGITFDKWENDPDLHDENLGLLFDFDLGRIVFDPYLGQEFNATAFSLNEILDYDFAYEVFSNFFVGQMQYGFTLESVNALHISVESILNYMIHHQHESILNVYAEHLSFFEANLGDTHFYFIDEHGNMRQLELPPDPPARASLLERIGMAVVTGLIIGGAILLIKVTGGAAAPALVKMLAGGAVMASMELTRQITIMGTPPDEVDWMRVGAMAIIGVATAGFGATAWGAKLHKKAAWVIYGTTGGLMGATHAWFDNGWDFEAILKGFGVGFVAGVVMFGICKSVGNAAKKLANNFRFKKPTPVGNAVNKPRVTAPKESTTIVKERPMQEHHFMTNKNKKFSPQFKQVVEKYGLTLDQTFNKQKMPHLGRHPNKYHQHVLNRVKAIDANIQANPALTTPQAKQAEFLRQFAGVRQEIISNPEMLYKAFWRGTEVIPWPLGG